jgi:hypothetical protein
MHVTKRKTNMARRHVDDATFDALIRVSQGIWISVLEAIGPEAADRACANMEDFGEMAFDNPYAERICKSLARAGNDA